MDKFLNDECEKIEKGKFKIEQVNCLAGEQYLEHIDEVQQIVDHDDLKPSLFELNHIILLNDQKIEMNNIKKLEKRKN